MRCIDLNNDSLKIRGTNFFYKKIERRKNFCNFNFCKFFKKHSAIIKNMENEKSWTPWLDSGLWIIAFFKTLNIKRLLLKQQISIFIGTIQKFHENIWKIWIVIGGMVFQESFETFMERFNIKILKILNNFHFFQFLLLNGFLELFKWSYGDPRFQHLKRFSL